jgi:integrase
MNALCELWMRSPGWKDRAPIVRELLEFFDPATAMRAIDGARIQDYVTFSLSQPVMVWLGGPAAKAGGSSFRPHKDGRTRSPARVNRHLVILRACFTRAFATRDPLTGTRAIEEIPAIKDLAEFKRKARPVPEAVLARLAEILPPHVMDGVIITLCFGFRRDEAFSLRLPQVDFEAGGVRLQAHHVKNKEDVFLPGSQFAMGYLRCLAVEADQRATTFLITWRPARSDTAAPDAQRWRPIKSPKTAWTTAMKIIMREFGAKWRWHDIRAAFITHVALTSGPVPAQRFARHKDFKTTAGYIEVSDTAMRDAAERNTVRPSLSIITGGKP